MQFVSLVGPSYFWEQQQQKIMELVNVQNYCTSKHKIHRYDLKSRVYTINTYVYNYSLTQLLDLMGTYI